MPPEKVSFGLLLEYEQICINLLTRTTQRTWTVMNYVAYWMSDAWNLAAWESASSMLVIGLSWCVLILNHHT